MIENLKTAGHNLSLGIALSGLSAAFNILAFCAFIAKGKPRNVKHLEGYTPWIILHTYFSFFEGLLNKRRIEEIQ